MAGSNKVAARHKGIKPGNRGRNAEWNSQDIEREGGVKPGTKMPFLISKGMYGDLDRRGDLYRGEIASNGRFGFITKKEDDRYVVVPDQNASNEYDSAR